MPPAMQGYEPMIPPSALTMTTVEERGRPFGFTSGQLETARGLAGSVISSPPSPDAEC